MSTPKNWLDDERPFAEMAVVAPESYFRRKPRRTFSRVAMVGAFVGLACGMLALVLQ